MGSAVGSLIPPGARSFGRYELLARLATGGMAEIFLARPRQGAARSRVVVIKRILPHLAEDSRFVAMFRDEARLAARIEHVNVCQVLELGSVGDTYFIAMEYLHGVPLSRVLLRSARTRQALPLPLIASIICQSCAGLHHAHELTSHDGRPLDVVHRDVSPPNIFVTEGGVVKLLDFGVAKARGASQKTRTGTVKGKNAYMSPEQVLGEAIDRRSDVFSLGIVLWESLTASRLFMRETDFDTFRAITRDQIPDVRERRPDTPEALAEVVARSLQRDRDRRFATAIELGEALAGAVADLGGPAADDDVAGYVRGQFGKELAGKRQLLAQATETEGQGAGVPNPAATAGPAVSASPATAAAAPASASASASASAVEPLDPIEDEDATVVESRPPLMDDVPVAPPAARRPSGPRSVGISGEIAAAVIPAPPRPGVEEPEIVVELDAGPSPAAEMARAAWLTLAGAAAVCALAALLWWLW